MQIILCKMFTAASGVVAFEQERQHAQGVIQKSKFLSIVLMVEVNGDKLVNAIDVETSKDKILSAEGMLQEMYRQKTTV